MSCGYRRQTTMRVCPVSRQSPYYGIVAVLQYSLSWEDTNRGVRISRLWSIDYQEAPFCLDISLSSDNRLLNQSELFNVVLKHPASTKTASGPLWVPYVRSPDDRVLIGVQAILYRLIRGLVVVPFRVKPNSLTGCVLRLPRKLEKRQCGEGEYCLPGPDNWNTRCLSRHRLYCLANDAIGNRR